PAPPLPYTTLFRSHGEAPQGQIVRDGGTRRARPNHDHMGSTTPHRRSLPSGRVRGRAPDPARRCRSQPAPPSPTSVFKPSLGPLHRPEPAPVRPLPPGLVPLGLPTLVLLPVLAELLQVLPVANGQAGGVGGAQ